MKPISYLNKKYLVIVFCVLICSSANATTWQTVGPGYWDQYSAWTNGIIPPISSSDTFIISHPIVLISTLTLNSNAYLLIDSTGGLCGHEKLVVYSNATVLKYGILELDSLEIPGGHVECAGPGPVILTLNGHLTVAGAYLHISGCSFAVGPWFECRRPEYLFMPVNEIPTSLSKTTVFPNPASDEINFTTGEQIKKIVIYDIIGKEIFIQKINTSSFNINTSAFHNGIYYFELLSDDDIKAEDGKFIVCH